MNERIRELYKNVLASSENMRWNIEDAEKFAELLIAECVKIVEELPPGYIDYRNQIEDAFRRDCVLAIKEKFGVERCVD